LQIIQYPHPVLRHPSKPLKRVDPELRAMIREMFGLMYAANGIGLAANQVGLPYRLFVLNLKASAEAPEEEHVFINPVITSRKGTAEGEEGCLSLPGLYAQVKRSERAVLNAYDLDGQEINLELDGLFARAAQHEIDHLDGVLFIDRLSPTARIDLADGLSDFEVQFEGARERGEIVSDAEIARHLAELEKLRT
jgi:peptide deformylase